MLLRRAGELLSILELGEQLRAGEQLLEQVYEVKLERDIIRGADGARAAIR